MRCSRARSRLRGNSTMKTGQAGCLRPTCRNAPSNHGSQSHDMLPFLGCCVVAHPKGRYKRVEEHNAGVTSGEWTHGRERTLPAGEEFLNVNSVEMCFSGIRLRSHPQQSNIDDLGRGMGGAS